MFSGEPSRRRCPNCRKDSGYENGKTETSQNQNGPCQSQETAQCKSILHFLLPFFAAIEIKAIVLKDSSLIVLKIWTNWSHFVLYMDDKKLFMKKYRCCKVVLWDARNWLKISCEVLSPFCLVGHQLWSSASEVRGHESRWISDRGENESRCPLIRWQDGGCEQLVFDRVSFRGSRQTQAAANQHQICCPSGQIELGPRRRVLIRPAKIRFSAMVRQLPTHWWGYIICKDRVPSEGVGGKSE